MNSPRKPNKNDQEKSGSSLPRKEYSFKLCQQYEYEWDKLKVKFTNNFILYFLMSHLSKANSYQHSQKCEQHEYEYCSQQM